MNLSPDLSSFSWTLKITIVCLLVSDAVLQIVGPEVLITNTSQYQCVVRPANDHDYRKEGLKVVDREKGIVLGTFFLEPNVDNYHTLLSWNNDTSKERCNKYRMGDFFTYMDLTLSASRCLQRTDQRCNESYCQMVMEVNFRYITTGCYNFEVVVKMKIVKDIKTVVETDFLFSKIKNPSCGVAYQRKIFNLYLRANLENMVFDDTAKLNVCYLESRNESLCITSQNMFNISMNRNKKHNNEQQSKYSYHVGYDSLYLEFVNVSQNVSIIILKLENDIRCSNAEIFFYKNFCHLVINLADKCKVVETIPSPYLQHVQNNFYGILLPPLIFPLILISSFVIAKKIVSKRDYEDSDLEENNKYAHPGERMDTECTENNCYNGMTKSRDFLVDKNVKKILLAYSQDCQEFMEVMKAFRIFLRDVMRFEVLDCFDSDLFPLTALDKYSWIDQLIRCQDTGIILVETPLAVIIDENITKRRAHVKYINPSMFSDVFIYILKQIRNSNTNSYDKMAVIRFEEYTDERFHLMDNKCVRFTIPNNLEDLFHHFSRMHKSPAYSDSCIEMKCLKTGLEKLGEFRAENTHHIQSIILL